MVVVVEEEKVVVVVVDVGVWLLQQQDVPQLLSSEVVEVVRYDRRCVELDEASESFLHFDQEVWEDGTNEL